MQANLIVLKFRNLYKYYVIYYGFFIDTSSYDKIILSKFDK